MCTSKKIGFLVLGLKSSIQLAFLIFKKSFSNNFYVVLLKIQVKIALLDVNRPHAY